MKIGDEVYVHGFVDEIRKDVIIIRNDGGYFGTTINEIYQNNNTILTRANDPEHKEKQNDKQGTENHL